MNYCVSIFHFCLKLKPHLNYVAVNNTFFCKLLLVLNCNYYWYYYYLKGNTAVEKRGGVMQVLLSELHFPELILTD
jgi:hypothetical protein